MSASSSPFHAYDIRGRLGKEFDKEAVVRYGYYIAKEFVKRTGLGVGRDVRATSPELFAWFTEGVRRAGVAVVDMGVCTTPQLYFSHWRLGLDCSVMITASHNPPEYNGFKVTGQGGEPIGYDNGLQTIEALSANPIPKTTILADIRSEDTHRLYIDYLRSFASERDGLRYVVDCMHGVVGKLVHEVLPDAEMYINDKANGDFLPEGPNPTIASNRRALQELVVEHRCDVGVIFDGDGDRVMFLDELGELVPPDLIIALLGEYFYRLKERDKSQPVLVDIRTSKSVTEFLQKLGVAVEVGRVGRVFMSRKLRATGSLFGGELAGHYYFGDFNCFDSGLLAAELVLCTIRAMKLSGMSLHAWVQKALSYYNSGELNFKIVPAVSKEALMREVRDHFLVQGIPTFESQEDGYRVEFRDWWFSIRSSNTEPLLRLIVETKEESQLAQKVEEASAILRPHTIRE